MNQVLRERKWDENCSSIGYKSLTLIPESLHHGLKTARPYLVGTYLFGS